MTSIVGVLPQDTIFHILQKIDERIPPIDSENYNKFPIQFDYFRQQSATIRGKLPTKDIIQLHNDSLVLLEEVECICRNLLLQKPMVQIGDEDWSHVGQRAQINNMNKITKGCFSFQGAIEQMRREEQVKMIEKVANFSKSYENSTGFSGSILFQKIDALHKEINESGCCSVVKEHLIQQLDQCKTKIRKLTYELEFIELTKNLQECEKKLSLSKNLLLLWEIRFHEFKKQPDLHQFIDEPPLRGLEIWESALKRKAWEFSRSHHLS